MGDDDEYGGPRICPVCALVKPAGYWPTNARHGYRVCPRCLAEGLGSVIPVDHTPESEWHVLAEIASAARRTLDRLEGGT